MALTSQQFAEELKNGVANRRAFWDHPWIRKFRRAELSKEQVRRWIEQQFYLTGKVQDLIGPLYVNCPDAEARVQILDNMVEEETGRMRSKSGCGRWWTTPWSCCGASLMVWSWPTVSRERQPNRNRPIPLL